MAASQPQNSLEETIGAIPTSELLSDSRDRSAPSLSKDLKSHTYPGDDEECAISPPSLSYLSSLACPGSRPDVSKSENSVEEASWAMGASRHYSSSESSDAACRPKKDGGLSSPCHSGSDGGKGCEKKVSSVVKGVHAKLRRKLKEADGDYEKIWNEHCEDEVSLGEYAYAMQHLAQEHWSAKHADDRIKWCHDACIEYFFQGGMKTVLEKDRRRRVHHGQRKEESRWPCNGSALVRNVNGNSNGNNISSSLLSSLEDFHQQYFDLAHPLGNRHNAISLPFSGQLRLLDVGSCFNPFLDYDEFLAVGIDISPAVEPNREKVRKERD